MKIREFTFIPENKDKPIKIVFEDDLKVIQTNDCTIEVIKRLSPMESEKLLKDMFSTTDIGVLDCSDIRCCDNYEHSYEDETIDGDWQLYCIKKLGDVDGSAIASWDCCGKFESK